MKKQKLTPEELSRIRAEAGRKGAKATKERGHFRGGRPKGSTSNPELLMEPTTSVSVAQSDYEILRRYAYKVNNTLKGAFHLLMKQIEPQLKKV